MVMGDRVKGLKGNEDLGQNIKVGKTKVHFQQNGQNSTQLLHDLKSKDVVDNTDTFVDHYKYWNDQIKRGNHTNGIVTPADPELTPIKGFKH